MTRIARSLFIVLPALLLAAPCVLARAQTAVQNPAQTRAPQTMAPDRKAYMDANAIKEPDQKIAALEKFRTEFPDSPSLYMAHQAIFDTVLKSYPDQKTRLLEQAGKALDKAPEGAKASLFNSFASKLCDAGILLDDAEIFAGKALELNKSERAQAQYLGTLGRISLKLGKLDEAEKALKEAAAANPQLAAVSLGLAELYERRGDPGMALAAYVKAAATGKIPAAARDKLNGLYAKAHNGSLAGLEDMLDARYMEANPPPFAVEPYKPSARRSNRAVLAEVFTGSGCPPCVAADLAADLAMERYSREELTMLMYHEHIPQPDPMTTPQTQARFKFYGGTGVPTVAVDGVTTVGGGARDAARKVYDRITLQIEKKLEAAAEATLRLSADRAGRTVKARVGVGDITSETPDVKLHIVLAEEKLRYTGENGVRFHPMVVRSMAADEKGLGLSVTSRSSQAFTWEFDLDKIQAEIKKHLDEYEAGGHRGSSFTFSEKKYAIDPEQLVVTAFVQDEKTKAVLQSITVKVRP